jgi:RHS repeat-associated protein
VPVPRGDRSKHVLRRRQFRSPLRRCLLLLALIAFVFTVDSGTWLNGDRASSALAAGHGSPQGAPGAQTRPVERKVVDSPADVHATEDAMKAAKEDAARRREELASPASEQSRTRSRTLYRGLAPAEALAVARRTQPAVTVEPLWQPPSLDPGERILRYESPTSAVIATDGSKELSRVEAVGAPFAAGPTPGSAARQEDLRPIDLELTASDRGWRPKRAAVAVEFPASGDGRIQVGDSLSVGVGAGTASAVAATGTRTASTKVFYAGVATDTDVLAEPVADGASVSWILRSSAAPERLTLDLGTASPKDGRANDDGSLTLSNSGRAVGIVSAPVAFDAQGVPVPTRFSVHEEGVSVEVDHRGRDFAYPIAVDPIMRPEGESPALAEEDVSSNPSTPRQTNWSQSTQQPGAFTFSDYAGTMSIFARGYDTAGGSGSGSAWFAFDPIRTSMPYKVLFAGVRTNHGMPGNTCVRVGIYSPASTWTSQFYTYWDGDYTQGGTTPWHTGAPASGWGNGQWQECNGNRGAAFVQACVISTCRASDAAGANSFVVFQVNTNGSWSATSRFKGAYIYHRENVPPTVSASFLNAADGWNRFDAGMDVRIEAHDDGVGLCGDALAGFPPVVTLTQTGRSAVLANAGNAGCSGMTYDRPAPSDQTYSMSVPADQLPEGRVFLTATTVDAVGNQLVRNLPRVDIDRSAPKFELSGDLYDQREAPIASGQTRALIVNATDGTPGRDSSAQRSGVAEVRVSVDGVLMSTSTQDDTSDSAPLDASWTPSPSRLPDGVHTVQVEAKDRLGHASTQQFAVRVGPYVPRAAEPGIGFEDWQTYDSTDTGAGSVHRVNLATGNSLWSVTPVSNPGIGFDTSMRLTYNSLEPSALRPDDVMYKPFAYGVAGRGVSVQMGSITRLNEPLWMEQSSGAPSVSGSSDAVQRIVLTDGDGTRQIFKRRANTDSSVRFDAPAGVHLELRRFENVETSSHYWAATRPDGSTFFFYRDGRPSESEDRHGNTLRLTWEERPDYAAASSKPGCGYATTCRYRVSEIVDAAALAPDGLETFKTAADRKWILHYDADNSMRLTSVEDRKLLTDSGSPVRRQTALAYDSDGRLTGITVAANAGNGAPKRTWGLGYVASTSFLNRVTDPVGNDTRIRYTAAQGATNPLRGPMDALLGFAATAAETRQVAGVADRASTVSNSTESRERVFRFATAAGTVAATELTTWVRDARNVSSRYAMDNRGRLTRVVEDLDDPTRADDGLPASPSVSPSYLQLGSTQTWKDDVNAVASVTRGIKGAGPTYDTAQAVTSEYDWGSLGELKREWEHKGVVGANSADADQRARNWTYNTHNGTVEGEGDAGGQFVYDVRTQSDRRGKVTTYEYFPGDKGDVEKVLGPAGAEERFTYEAHGLVSSHATRQWGGGEDDDSGKPKWAKADPTLEGDVSEKTFSTDSYREFDGNGEASLRVDARGKNWRTVYDATGNAVFVGDPRAGANVGLPGAEQAPLAASETPASGLQGALRDSARSGAGGAYAYVARFTYDGLDRQVASATPKRSAATQAGTNNPVADRFAVTATNYDRNDNATAERDAEGQLTLRTFTKTDQIASEQEPAAPQHAEPASGDPDTWATSADRSPITKYGYDADDNLVVRKDPVPSGDQAIDVAGYRKRWTFDRLSRTVLQVEEGKSGAAAELKLTSRAYDNRDNVVGEIDPRTNGAADEVTAVANAAAGRDLRYKYDPDTFDRVSRKTENPRTGYAGTLPDANHVTTWAFDKDDRQTETRSPGGRLTKRVYDDRGDLVQLDEPFGYDATASEKTTSFATTKITRRLDGKPTEIISPRGNNTDDDEDKQFRGDDAFRTRYRYLDTGELERRWIPKVKDQYGAGEWEVRYDINDVGDPVHIRDARGKLFDNTFLDTGELATTTRPSWWIYDQSDASIRERTEDDPTPADGATGTGGTPSEPGNGDFGKVEPQELPDVMPAAGDTAVTYNDRLQPTQVKGQADTGTDTISQTLGYDQLGRLTQRQIPKQSGTAAGSTIELAWQYNVRGLPRAARRLRTAEDGGSATTYWEYDGFDRQTKTTEPPSCQGSGCLGPVTTQEYDRNDVVTQEHLPAETAPSNDHEGTTTGTRRYYVDNADRVTGVEDESGGNTWTSYDADGMAVKVFGPRAGLRVEEDSGPVGPCMEQWCDEQPAETNPEDYVTEYRYDGAGRQTRARTPVTDADGTRDLITDTEYDRDGNPARVESPGAKNSETDPGAITQRVTTRVFDARGLPWKSTVGSGSNQVTTLTEYDGAGNLRRTVNPKGVSGTGATATPAHADEGDSGLAGFSAWNASVQQYDADQRLIGRTLPWNDTDGSPTTSARTRFRQTFERSNRGLVQRITGIYDAKDGTGEPVADTRIERNLAGWPVSSTDRTRTGSTWTTVGDPLKYDYDQLGNQTLWSSVGGNRTIQRSFYRSGQLRVKCGRRTAGGSQEQVYSYRYNTGGSLAEIVDWMHYTAPSPAEACQPAEQNDAPTNNLPVRRTSIERDRAERPTVIDERWNGGKDTVFRYFASVPNLVKSVQTDGTYDSEATDGNNEGQVDDGNQATDEYDGGQATTYSYDEQDRNTQVRVRDDGKLSGTVDRTTDMTWWPSSERRSTTKPATSSGNRTVDSRYYNSRGELVRRRAAPASGTTKSYDYDYDNNGNRTKDERGTSSYNARDQLTEWTRIRRTGNGTAIPEGTGDQGYVAPTAQSPAKTTRYKSIDGAGRPLTTEEVVKTPQAGIGLVATTINTTNVYSGDRLTRAERTTKAVPPNGANAKQSTSAQTDCFDYDVFGSQTQTYRQTTTKNATAAGQDITPPTPTSECKGNSSGAPWLGVVENRNVFDTFERQAAGRQRVHGNVENSDAGTLNGTQAFCYDPFDRRDRRVTGLTGADDPAAASEEGDGRTRAQTACTTAATKTGVEAFDYSYVGLTEQLSRENRNGRVQTYEYTASGERLGRLKTVDGNKEWRSYDTDAQGTVVGLEKPTTGETTPETSADGTTKLNTYEIDAFGAPVGKESDLAPDAATNPFRFQGFYNDPETGTYDMQARAYQPSTGRFLQQDRYEDPEADLQLAGDPLTSSRYSFTAGNPSTRAEYDGHDPHGADEHLEKCKQAGAGGTCGQGTAPSTGPAGNLPGSTKPAQGPNGPVPGSGRPYWRTSPSNVDVGSNPSETAPAPQGQPLHVPVAEAAGSDRPAPIAAKAAATDLKNGQPTVHGLLDTAGTLDPTPLSDGLNAAIYAAEGDEVNAAISVASMAPYVGDGAKLGRGAMRTLRKTTSGACSFGGSTPVLMANGELRPISRIRVGDYVTATDPETGKQHRRKVTHTWKHLDQLHRLDLVGETIDSTEDHPFWNATDGQWEKAQQLDRGDQVLTAGGRTVKVLAFRPSPRGRAGAYNLTVATDHTYYAGLMQVLVHNANGACEIPLVNGRRPINHGYAGAEHPSGVPFTKQGFPDFSSRARAEYTSRRLTGSYRKDAAMANKARGLPRTPPGMVWHHVEDGRTMQLIPRDIHNAARHTGGAAVIRGRR